MRPSLALILAAGLAFASPAVAHDAKFHRKVGDALKSASQSDASRDSAPDGASSPGDPGALPGFGGAFNLVDHNGVSRSERDFHDHFMLVVFGFTECQDVCPLELQAIAGALDLLGADADRVAPIFITIDPEVDTPSRLKDYLAKFHPAIVGLTGPQAEIDRVMRVYRAQSARLNEKSAPGRNKFGHTSFLYLMGPDGGFRSLFLVAPSAEEIAERLRKYLATS